MQNPFLIIIALLLTSCGVTTFQVYSFDLSGVKTPNVVDFSDLKKDETGKYTFEDEFIKITWEPDNQQFKFLLTNKSANSIQITWDNASFVDYEGRMARVIHSGVTYINRYEPQAQTTIPCGSTLYDMLVPINNIYYDPGTGWDTRQIIPTVFVNAWTRSGLTKVRAVSPGYLGKRIAFLLPIVINGIQNDYLFTFEINHIPIDSGTIIK